MAIRVGSRGVPDADQPARTRDPARLALLAVLDVRGRPIRRDRGMVPSAEFRRAADRYLDEHHSGFCVKFARGCSARHVPLEDLIQACRLGAYTALERFDADHEHAYRFLSYARWYMLLETRRLLHGEECLVVYPDELKTIRSALARTCRDDVPDEDAAVHLCVPVEVVRAARTAHLGHDHRRVDERSRACRRGLEELRADREARLAALRRTEGLREALRRLDPMLRAVLHDEFEVFDPDDSEAAAAPRPSTDQARRSLRHMAMRRLREELEAAADEEVAA